MINLKIKKMKTINLKKEWLLWIILLLPFGILLFIWDKLPQQVATHWNIHGEADDYSSKAFGALFMPLLNIGLYLLLIVLPKIDPRKRNYDLFQGPFFMIRLALAAFLTGIHLITLYIAMGKTIEIEKIIPAAVFVLLIIF